jgi:hypothetical protein
MAEDDEGAFSRMVAARDYRAIAERLIALESLRGLTSFQELGEDPESALLRHPEVTIEYDTSPLPGCSVYGYYRPGTPAIILVHPSLTPQRDNFTVLHEFGHHVQRMHVSWADVRYGVPTKQGAAIEERVADAFAAEVLLPTASMLAGEVGLRAVAMRAAEVSRSDERAAVIVADLNGLVTFARAVGDDVRIPARGSIQPGIARAMKRALANGGVSSGELSEGLQFASGWAEHDLSFDVALDDSGQYGFVILRSTQKFGPQSSWDVVEAQCPRSACELVYAVDASIEICGICHDPKCPNCKTCSCEPPAAAQCESCFLALSLAEMADPSLHECA